MEYYFQNVSIVNYATSDLSEKDPFKNQQDSFPIPLLIGTQENVH